MSSGRPNGRRAFLNLILYGFLIFVARRVAAHRELVDPERLGDLPVGDHHGVGLVRGLPDDGILEVVGVHVDDLLAQLLRTLRESRGGRGGALRARDHVADESVEARALELEGDADPAVSVLLGRAQLLPLRALEPLQLEVPSGLEVLRLADGGASRAAGPHQGEIDLVHHRGDLHRRGDVLLELTRRGGDHAIASRSLLRRRRERVTTVGRGLGLVDLAPSLFERLEHDRPCTVGVDGAADGELLTHERGGVRDGRRVVAAAAADERKAQQSDGDGDADDSAH